MPERNKGSSRLHFSEEQAPDASPSKAEKAADRAEKIRTNIPKKKTLSVTRATDEATGKTRLHLHLEEKSKPAPSFHSMGVTHLPLSEVHRQIGKAEEENTGVEAAHHGEEATEKTARFAEHSYAMYISVLGNREDLFRGNPYASTLREPGKHDVPEAYLEDETFRRILEEAEKYIGYPYVWGGDSPETSFDCSGFVSYVFTNSGVRNVGRLGATSLYGACRKITPEEAKPGDLVFFEKTISGVNGITHCGIYVGDGFMLHCGSPIGYADLRDSYWQQHFFGYGRLAKD